MKIRNCRFNHFVDPLGFSADHPSVSWTVEECAGKKQSWARVQVSEDEDFSSLLYDSGEDETASSLFFPLPIDLKPYTRYFWKVRVKADSGESAESDVNWFETAKLQDPWEADWISCGAMDTQNPVFSTEYVSDTDLDNVRAYVCGLGVYELYINGKKAGNEFLAPGMEDYNRWLQYQTYELHLKKGRNTIELSLGNGWYKGRFGFQGAEEIYGDSFLCILELRQNGRLLCATDQNWQVRPGRIVFNNIYDGEWIDAAAELAVQVPVTLAEGRTDLLRARLSLPVVVKEELPVKAVIHTPAGETVLDMGQEFAGFLRFRCREPKGTKIRLQYGEILQDGNFYNENLRTAKAEFIYISDGEERTVRAHFTYYGFRYVKVEGVSGELSPEDFTGCALYSDLQRTGWISTDNEKVNRLIKNIIWSQKSNYLDAPTDCPQRDERMGWTGDTQMFSGSACFNMYSYPFLNKFLYDCYETQQELGYMPHTIPAFDNEEPTAAAWGDAATIIPWNLYLFYGDQQILLQQYESMKMWVDEIRAEEEKNGSKRLWEPERAFGDWLAMDHEDPDERYQGGTDLTYLSTAYYYYSARIVAEAAAVLGKKEDAASYAQLADEVKAALQKEFFTAGGRLAVPTQTGYVLALFMDFAPEGTREKLIWELDKKLEANHSRIKTGFIGTPYICRVLSENGKNEMAYRLLLNEENPSWLYAVDMGATTVWERWNAVLPDGTINGTDMTSLNHYAYGSVIEWMYRDMAGLQPVQKAPGFKKAMIEPHPDPKIGKLDMRYDSAAGTYEVHWEQKKGGLALKVTVPFDAEAVLILPDGKEKEIEAGTYEFFIQEQKGGSKDGITGSD